MIPAPPDTHIPPFPFLKVLEDFNLGPSNFGANAWAPFAGKLGEMQTRIHFIKQGQTLEKLHLLMEMTFKHEQHLLASHCAGIFKKDYACE